MEFVKYQGTGNDFVILDGRNKDLGNLDVAWLCDRRFGIGADGLMILKEHRDLDFEMVYFNSDGRLSSMCGNGGRCLAHFAHSLGIGNNNKVRFIAVDGIHEATVNNNYVNLGMNPVNGWEKRDEDVFILNTGSPHYVKILKEPVGFYPLNDLAVDVRYGPEFEKEGINVNIVNILGEDRIGMRTYERGVEAETLSCGTGVTAAALAFQLYRNQAIAEIQVETPGGNLQVNSDKNADGFHNIILSGPVEAVFRGSIS